MRKSTKGRGPVIVAALGTVVVALLFFGSLLSVSYTHLDVYKRQGTGSGLIGHRLLPQINMGFSGQNGLPHPLIVERCQLAQSKGRLSLRSRTGLGTVLRMGKACLLYTSTGLDPLVRGGFHGAQEGKQ